MDIFTTMITPYKDDGSVDYSTAEKYVDWYFEIEGNDIIYLCRTAINRPENYHNSNYSIFDRIKDFRNL